MKRDVDPIGRPNEDDWRELVAEWWAWAGNFPIRTSRLYDRVAVFLDGFQYAETPNRENKWVKFGMALSARRGTVIDGLRLRSGLRDTKPVWWVECVDRDAMLKRILARTPLPYEQQAITPQQAERFIEVFGVPPSREQLERLLASGALPDEMPPDGSPCRLP